MTEQGCAKQPATHCFFACTLAFPYTLHKPLAAEKHQFLLYIHGYSTMLLKLPALPVAIRGIVEPFRAACASHCKADLCLQSR